MDLLARHGNCLLWPNGRVWYFGDGDALTIVA
jgi:hypothetical protein